MSQSDKLISTLKQELRQQGKTYSDLTTVLELSLPSVKRLFAEGNFSLTRIEKVCNFLGMDFTELVTIMEKAAEKIDQLTFEQEMELVKDTKFLCVAHALLNRWSFAEIVDAYEISGTECIRHMARLDKMKLIELLPGNRYKLLVSRRFSWIELGPIQSFFEKQLQSDFFNSSFNKQDEIRLFVSAMLSRGSIDKVIDKAKRLADEVNDYHLENERLTLDQKQGVSVVLAIRPWETKVFAALRRKSTLKK